MTASLSIELMSEQAGDRTSWVHLIPAGMSVGIDGRGPYHLRDMGNVIAATRKYFGRRQVVIDYEHQTEHSEKNGQPAPAAGWIIGLEARDNGIWGLVEWTETAAAHIAKREYRYISPVFYYRPDGTVTMLKNASLTNTPNLDQLVALNSAEAPMDKSNMPDKSREAALLLGMPETSDQAAVIARIKQVIQIASELGLLSDETGISVNSAIPDPTKFVPIGDFQRAVSEVNKLRSGVTKERAEAHVADHIRAGIILPFMKDWAVSLCTTNMKSYEEFVSGVGPGFSTLLATSGATSAPPGERSLNSAKPDLSIAELAVCKNMGLTTEQYLNTRTTSATHKE